jgi:hypothetical protein
MALIRVQMIGTGAPADPFRTPLPTMTLVDVDYVNKTMVVDVPSVDIPTIYLNAGNPTRRALKGLDVVTGLDPATLEQLRDHLAKRYGVPATAFSPVLLL